MEMNKNRKYLLFLIFIFLCTSLCAEDCDSTFKIYKTREIVAIGLDTFPQRLKDVRKECLLPLMDSINDENIYYVLHFIAMYYYYIEPNAHNALHIDKVDSSIIAKISYGLASSETVFSENYRNYFKKAKQLSWILQRDSLSRKSLQKYVINHNGNVDWNIVSYISEIRDTASFWLIYKNIKEERKNDGDALRYLIYCGIEKFEYYSLFVENAADLIRLDNSSMVASTLISTLSQKYSYDIAKKTFSKLVLDEQLMRKYSLCDGKNMSMSVFNHDFYWGIFHFYPQIIKTNEYINTCNEYLKKGYFTGKTCTFDKRLYNLLVKTIKTEYKDLK